MNKVEVTLYLRNRCQMYHEYSHVLDCTKSDTWVDWAQHKKYMYFWYCILLLRAPSRLYRRRYFQVNSIKYSLFSICRDLDYVHYFAPLQSQQFSKCSSKCLMMFSHKFRKFWDFSSNSPFFEQLFMQFAWILFRESIVEQFSYQAVMFR